MKSRLKEKEMCIKLRKQGYSYKEIMKEVNVSKSSLSGWFKFLDLSSEEEAGLQERALKNIGNGRERAALSNRNKRIEREAAALKEAQKIFDLFKNDTIFVLGIGLYWAEGSKRTSAFQFVNSDPAMILFMLYWAEKYLTISRNDIFLRLSTHEDFRSENYEVFWQDLTGLQPGQFRKTTYKPNEKHGIFKKNPKYKGCIRIEIKGGMRLLRIMLSLREILEEHLKMLY